MSVGNLDGSVHFPVQSALASVRPGVGLAWFPGWNPTWNHMKVLLTRMERGWKGPAWRDCTEPDRQQGCGGAVGGAVGRGRGRGPGVRAVWWLLVNLCTLQTSLHQTSQGKDSTAPSGCPQRGRSVRFCLCFLPRIQRLRPAPCAPGLGWVLPCPRFLLPSARPVKGTLPPVCRGGSRRSQGCSQHSHHPNPSSTHVPTEASLIGLTLPTLRTQVPGARPRQRVRPRRRRTSGVDICVPRIDSLRRPKSKTHAARSPFSNL